MRGGAIRMRTRRERVPTAAQYYRVTGDSFRALCPAASGHMNMGVWPAPSLLAAQESLVRLALDRAQARLRTPGDPEPPRGILDLGSGWGASRPLFDEAFPRTPYFGVNISREQIDVARVATAHVPRTTYVVGRVEDREALPWSEIDLLFSIEAAFHFEDKRALLREAAARGIRLLNWMEICVEDRRLAKDPLLAPALRNAWSVKEYQQALGAARLERITVEDVGDRVFPGFLAYLDALDDRAYRGRRAVLDQLRRATRAIAAAALRGDIRYVLLQAAAS